MGKRWLAVSALVVAIAFAGCTSAPESTPPEGDDGSAGGNGNGSEDPGDGSSGGPVPGGPIRSSHFGGCSIHSGLFHLPAAVLEGEYPDGFSPVYGDAAEQTVLLGISGFSCANATAGTIETDAYREVHLYALVEPPADLQDSGVAEYRLHFFGVTSDDRMAALYWDWGLYVEVATITVEETEAEALRIGEINAESEWEIFEFHTIVDSTTTECISGDRTRMFTWGFDDAPRHVDTDYGPHCVNSGGAKFIFPEPFSQDPFDLAFWALINGSFTGTGTHAFGEELSIEQRRPE